MAEFGSERVVGLLKETWTALSSGNAVLPTTPSAALTLYLQTDPFVSAVLAATLLALLVWAISLPFVSDNYSIVDRLWSILPPLYAWHFTLHAFFTDGFFNSRLLLVSLLTSLWGFRLTFNYWRKGGYSLTAEDYRWAYVRQRIGEPAFQLLNLVFVAFIQNYLLMLLASGPSYVAWLGRAHQSAAALNTYDYAAAALFVLFLLGETVADEQQWAFQTKKRLAQAKRDNSDPDVRRGFLTTGLFRYSRHPNFFCEISLWWCVHAFGLATLLASGALKSKCPFFLCCQAFHWSCLGAALLTLLFQGSTELTERITLSKYPEYALYQETTSRLFPAAPDSWPEQEQKKNK